MPFIILGVLVINGLLAMFEIIRNMRGASSKRLPYSSKIIHLPKDLEREKRLRNII